MKTVKAATVLPEKLIKEIQKYVQGETIYIPKTQSSYQKWGSCSGGRKALDNRNASIRKAFKQGMKIEQLAEKHYLSIDSIKKIVYTRE